MRCVVDSQRIDAADAAIAIPMLGMANSLNVATAATREAREPHGASVRAFRQAAWMRERSIIACVSNPLGIVPKARPQSPSRRVAQNASATAGVEYRTNKLPCMANAIISTTRRATGSNSFNLLSRHSTSSVNASRRLSVPRPLRTSPKNTETVSGSRCIARRTSRQMTLPVPSHIPLRGASR
jgi:hypothetical protein